MGMRDAIILTTVATAGTLVAVCGAKLDPKFSDGTNGAPTPRRKRCLTDAVAEAVADEEKSDEYKSACAAWHTNKGHLSLLFKVLGQMLVAPIVLKHVESINEATGNALRLPWANTNGQ